MLRMLVATGLMSALLATTGVHAADVAAKPTPPDQLVQQTGEELLRRIQKNQIEYRNDPAKLYAMVDEVVLPHFDFEIMSKLVLARSWKEASEAQRKRFQRAFRDLLVKTYGDALLGYSNEKIEWKPLPAPPEGDRVKVDSRILSPGAPPIPMQYSLYLTDTGWKVYDVSIDNISLVTNYRGTYSAEIRRNGLDALIAALEDKAS